MLDQIKNIIQSSVTTKERILDNEILLSNILLASQEINMSLQAGGKILFCGNGGSAADAQHLAAEFSGRFYKDRAALPAEALHVNSSYLTAVANDYSFDVVYSRLIDGIGRKGDILIGISTSGNSTNIVNALKKAKEKEMLTISMTGENGGIMKGVSDILLNIPSTDTPRIQESHIMVGHIICQLVEELYFGN